MPSLRPSRISCLVVLLLAGCAAPSFEPVPITDPDQRYSLVGVSVLPPQGPSWFFVGQDAMTLSFTKEPPESDTQTALVVVTSSPMKREFSSPEEFLEFVGSGIRSASDPDRFRFLVEEYSLDDRFGAYCVKLHNKVEDHGSKGREGQNLIIENRGYWFLHPEDPIVSVVLLYSERFDPDAGPPDGALEADPFLQGAELRPLQNE